MLKPGEKVVAATTYKHFILVFGDMGTVLHLDHDPLHGGFIIHKIMELGSR